MVTKLFDPIFRQDGRCDFYDISSPSFWLTASQTCNHHRITHLNFDGWMKNVLLQLIKEWGHSGIVELDNKHTTTSYNLYKVMCTSPNIVPSWILSAFSALLRNLCRFGLLRYTLPDLRLRFGRSLATDCQDSVITVAARGGSHWRCNITVCIISKIRTIFSTWSVFTIIGSRNCNSFRISAYHNSLLMSKWYAVISRVAGSNSYLNW